MKGEITSMAELVHIGKHMKNQATYYSRSNTRAQIAVEWQTQADLKCLIPREREGREE